MSFRAVVSVTLLLLTHVVSASGDWPRFRGPNGSGVAVDSRSLPSHWSATENIAWKTPLPGPGASSPIIVDGRVLVTCYSGYGVDRDAPGDVDDLVRHLLCIDLDTGRVMWRRDIEASLPEDPYDRSGVSSHGYASHTPVSDGANIYAFFGKGGVYAFDVNGRELWKADAGIESDPPCWGSSSSPVLHGDTLVVTAAAESQSMIGFDKATGKRVWQQDATGLDGMWGTPAFVSAEQGRTDLVMLVPGELWGLDPRTGLLRWSTEATESRQAYASVLVDGDRLFAFSGQGGGSAAFDVAGTTATRAWDSKQTTTYATPVLYGERIYVVTRGVLSVLDASSGQRVGQLRLKGAKRTGGPFGSLDYGSPVVVGDRLFYLNARGQCDVIRIDDDVESLALNEVGTGDELFWGSPAVSRGRLVFRSSTTLYAVAAVGQTIAPARRVGSDVGPRIMRSSPVRARGSRRFIDPKAVASSKPVRQARPDEVVR